MDRDRALPLALGLVAIFALALSAATLNSAVVSNGASGLGGDDEGFGNERRPADDPGLGGGTTGNASSGGAAVVTPCWPALREPPVLAGLGLLFLGLFGAAYRSTRSGFASAVVCGGVAVPVGLVWAALAYCPPPPSPGARNATGIGVRNGSGPSGGAGGFGRAGAEALSSPTALLILVVVVGLAVVAVAVYATGRDDAGRDDAAGPDPEPEPDRDEAATERIGRIAGAAADRIDDDAVDVDNEVYRAWRRMTASLDVDSPETTTPREFERAAVDAGMTRDDVGALTDLFEAVRYGDRDPTEDAEHRAVETLRRIEAGDGGA